MIILHWGIAILVTVHLVNAFTLHLLRDVQTALLLQELHRSFGLMILVATVVRLAVRFMDGTPPIAQQIPTLQKYAAKTVHASFYVILLVSPFIGWAYTNSIGMPVSFFWVVPLPDIVAYNPDLSTIYLDLHLYFAFALLATLTVHVAASFYNKYIRKNTVFEKILFPSNKHMFSSYLPIWIRMSIASVVALIACGIIGYSGLRSTLTIGEAYDKVFQSVAKIRAAQVGWQQFSSKLAWNDFKDDKEIKKQLAKISKSLKSVVPAIDKKTTKANAHNLYKQVYQFSQTTSFDIQQSPAIKKDMVDISTAFKKIIQELAVVAFEARQNFVTLSARQNDQVVFTLVTVFCMSAIIIIFMTTTTSIQISRATKLADNISRGNLKEKVNVIGHSETASLMRSLEHMRNSLNNQYNWIQDLRDENTRFQKTLTTQQTVKEKITIIVDGREIESYAFDISDSGMYIDLVEGVEENSTVVVVDSSGVRREAQVLWASNDIIGLRFLEASSTHVA